MVRYLRIFNLESETTSVQYFIQMMLRRYKEERIFLNLNLIHILKQNREIIRIQTLICRLCTGLSKFHLNGKLLPKKNKCKTVNSYLSYSLL